jgi:multicomponent Na+:H+ antiporter subunit G
MAVKEIVESVLLAVGVLLQLACCLGLLVIRDTFDQLHLLSAAGAIGPVAIAAAVIVEHGLSSFGIKAVLVTVMIGLTGPIMTHAIAKATRVRREGGLRAGPGPR